MTLNKVLQLKESFLFAAISQTPTVNEELKRKISKKADFISDEIFQKMIKAATEWKEAKRHFLDGNAIEFIKRAENALNIALDIYISILEGEIKPHTTFIEKIAILNNYKITLSSKYYKSVSKILERLKHGIAVSPQAGLVRELFEKYYTPNLVKLGVELPSFKMI